MSKLEPEPPMSESSPRKVVHNAYMSRRFSEEQDVDMESVVDFHF
jgi:hypothetical protein